MTLLAPPAATGLRPGLRPRFSVVVAAYQAAGTVAESVGSALAQDEPPLEVVICDDGSTDGTPVVLDALVQRYGPMVRALRQDNAGEAAARNAAVGTARGDWVVVLDADDLFLPGRLRALADAVQDRPDLDVITTDAWHEVDGTRTTRVYGPAFRFPVTDQRSALLRRNLVFGLAAVRRSRLLEVGGYDEQVGVTTDWACWLRLVLTGSVLGCVDEPLAVYRIDGASLSGDRTGVLAGRLRTLERTALLPSLTAADRTVLRESTAAARRELELDRARTALITGAADRRALLLEVVRAPAHGASTRAKALWAAAFPAAAARRVSRPEAQSRTAQGFRQS